MMSRQSLMGWSRKANATSELRRAQGSSADRLTQTVNHYLLKPFDRRWRSSEHLLAGFFQTISRQAESVQHVRRNAAEAPPLAMFEKAANVDEFNVRHAADRLDRLGANVRVLVVLADGMTRGSLTALSKTVTQIEAVEVTKCSGPGCERHDLERIARRDRGREFQRDR